MKNLSGIRICMATSAHPPSDDRIFFKESRSLVKAGAKVTIICPNKEALPSNSFGIKFVTYNGGGSIRNRLKTIHRLYSAIAKEEYDIVHAHEPDSLIAALQASRQKDTKVIFDSHELWGGIFATRFPQSLWRFAEVSYNTIERFLLQKCDGAIGATESISEHLSETLPNRPVSTILNTPVVEVFGTGSKRTWGETTYLCHDGYLSFNRGLKTMVKAAHLLSKKHKIVFRIVGDVFGDERSWLEHYVLKHRLQNVITRTGWLPYNEVGRAISDCHIGLIALTPTPNNMIAAPNKCFNYLLYGLPIVAPNYPRSHFVRLAEEGCAVLTDPTDPEKYANTISLLIEQKEATIEMSRRATAASLEKYRWCHMEPKLYQLYEELLDQRTVS